MARTSIALSLPVHPGLKATSRAARRELTQDLQTVELGILLGLGAVAALTTVLLDFGLRLPGHAILRTTLPMVLGLALVPRRHAGAMMSIGALMAVLGMAIGGGRLPGVGAATSLMLTGPLLDLATRGAQDGGRVYRGFAVAGLASNSCAFLVRAVPKLAGIDPLGTRSLGSWLTVALLSYAACGLAAGLLSGMLCFRLDAAQSRSTRRGTRRVIYVGLDDTDMPDTPGTNQLAKALAVDLADHYRCVFLLRHQLLRDERIPYTRHNSAATLCLTPRHEPDVHALLARVRGFILDRAADG